MKNLKFILVFMLWIVACGTNPDNEKTTTEIHIIFPEVPLCDKQFVSGDTIVWQNFQMRNITPVDWNIIDIEVRGNSTCAFKVYREPFVNETGMQICPEESSANSTLGMIVPFGQSIALRIEYKPSAEGAKDFATIVITSNAQVKTQSVVIDQIWTDPEDEATEEEAEITKIYIPLCGASILPMSPDAGLSAEESGKFPYTCPTVAPGYIGDDSLICGEPLPENSPGCQ